VANESGKQPGTDLRDGVLTLPVLLALEAEGPDSELMRLLRRPDERDVQRALELLQGHAALAAARDAAREQAALARSELDRVPSDLVYRPALGGLAFLTEYAADRAG
jgi:heptaprenyl diphosphate synthase